MNWTRRRPIAPLTIICLVVLLACASVVHAAPTPPPYTGCAGVASVPVTDAAVEKAVLDLLNNNRGSGKPELKVFAPLQTAAELHAVDMGFDGYHSHDSMDPDPQHPGQFLSRCGMEERIMSYYSQYPWGEIIGWGYKTPAEMVNWWMASQVHHDIIMDASFNAVGIGYYTITRGSTTDYLWVVDFNVATDPVPTDSPTATSPVSPTPTALGVSPTPTPSATPTAMPSPTESPQPTNPNDSRLLLPIVLN